MNGKEPSGIELIMAYIAWCLLAVGIIWIMSSCGGCWDTGSRLFLK